MQLERLKRYLDSQKINYVSLVHYETYTAQEIAQSAHVSGEEMAKTVIVKIDGKIVMAVLPASQKIDFALLKEAAGAGKVDLASEEEFMDMFPDCEIGAMPPFGNLYGMEVYVAESLEEDEEIVFNAGSHIDLIKLSFKDFARLVKPKVMKFSSRDA